MSWLRVDAGFWKHPKVQDVELAPIGLHVLALSYCADNLTDGLVPEGWVRRQAFGDLALAQALVDAGLWESDPHGFRVHDYLDYNPSRAAVELDREAAKQRMRKARDSSRSVEVRANSTRSSSNPTPIPTEEASPLQTAVTTSQPPSTTPERSPAVRANTDGVVESGEVIDGDPEAIRLATLMRETMVARWRRHEFRRRAPALTDAWVRDMRLLMRDGAEPKQIEYAIAWMDGASEGGLFWAENVRTPKKLRESGWRSWPTSAARARAAPRGAGRPDVELSVASSARRSPRWSDEGARQPESGASAGTGQLSPAPPSPTWAQWLRIAGLIDEWWPASEFDEGHIRAYFPELDRHSADEVQAAVRACLHDGSAFAPSLAQLMVKLERPVIELPAWVMVYNRLRWAVEREVGENAAIQALFREHAAIAQCVIEYGYDRLRAEPFTDTQLAGVVRSA